jgi:ABC-type phosphate/phosphonate transport system substrate-binding protein
MAMTPHIASLGMYDSTTLRDANDALWSAIAGRLRSAGLARVPDELDRSRPLPEIWDDPDLLFAQTCGYPLMTRWSGRLRYVTTPRYRAPGCEGPTHRSRIVVRRDDDTRTLADFRGRHLALNERGSNTGMNLLRALIAPLARGGLFFGRVTETGSHWASARAVAGGAADIAAIDAVSYFHLEREAPDIVARLRTLCWSEDGPTLPFVTAAATPESVVRKLRHAITQAIGDARTAADALLLDGVETVGLRRYRRLITLENRSVRIGYPVLA